MASTWPGGMMLTDQDPVADIARLLASKRVTVLCGAGLSFNSGLPVADSIKAAILARLGMTPEDVALVYQSSLPLEAFMQTILHNGPKARLHEIFDGRTPNTNHRFLALLAKCGCLAEVYTTNFDALLETALADAGLGRGTDFVVHSRDKELENMDGAQIDPNRCHLFKLHGTIDQPEQIAITLQMVSSRALVDRRQAIVRRLFQTGPHETVLILGYSASDDFDINPILRSLDGEKKKVVFVQHSDRQVVEPLSSVREGLFSGFTGTALHISCDRLTKQLWQLLGPRLQAEYQFVKEQPNWQPIIDDWSSSVERVKPELKKFISGMLMLRLGAADRARSYFEAVRLEMMEARDRAIVLGNLAAVHVDLGNSNRGIELASNAFELFQSASDVEGSARAQTTIGRAHHQEGDLQNAESHFSEALRLSSSVEDLEEVANSYSNLAPLLARRGKRSFAVRYWTEALRLQRILGDVGAEAKTLHERGKLASQTGDAEAALPDFQEAARLSRLIGDPDQACICYLAAANTALTLSKFVEAQRLFTMAERFAATLRDEFTKVLLQLGLGNLESAQRNRIAALQRFTRAYDLADSAGFDDLLPAIRVNVRVTSDQSAFDRATFDTQSLLAQFDRELAGETASERASEFMHNVRSVKLVPSELGDRLDVDALRGLVKVFPAEVSRLLDWACDIVVAEIDSAFTYAFQVHVTICMPFILLEEISDLQKRRVALQAGRVGTRARSATVTGPKVSFSRTKRGDGAPIRLPSGSVPLTIPIMLEAFEMHLESQAESMPPRAVEFLEQLRRVPFGETGVGLSLEAESVERLTAEFPDASDEFGKWAVDLVQAELPRNPPLASQVFVALCIPLPPTAGKIPRDHWSLRRNALLPQVLRQMASSLEGD